MDDTQQQQQQPPPTDYASFKRIITDFMTDLATTFPEYAPVLHKHLAQAATDDYAALYAHCQQAYPPQFFNILYKTAGNEVAEPLLLLPEIDFRPIITSTEITEQTRDSLWQYLQLTLFTIIGTIKDRTAFGDDTANLFGAISPEEMQAKMKEAIENMQDILGGMGLDGMGMGGNAAEAAAGVDMSGNMPNVDELHNHLNGILGGQIGKFAAEITEEWAGELGVNLDDTTINSQQGMTEFFMKLMKDPAKLYTLMKRIGERFEQKIKSGELSQKEMEREAKELAEKLKNIPGMERWGSTLAGMTQGRGGRGSGANNAAAAASAEIVGLRKQLEFEQMKERLRAKRERRNTTNAKKAAMKSKFVPDAPAPIPCSDEELIAMFEPAKRNAQTKNK